MEDNNRPTVYIVDDDDSVLRSLSRLMGQANYEARTFSSAESFLQSRTGPHEVPACMLLDLSMPGISGLELQSRLLSGPSACPVIFISGNASIPSTVQAMKQGAVTFLSKPFDNQDLLVAIAEGLQTHSRQLEGQAQLNAIRERIRSLTEREAEVMSWVITGAMNKQIASHLGIVEKTVKVHRGRVMEKMRSESVAELVRLCAVAGVSPAVVPTAALVQSPIADPPARCHDHIP